MFVSRKKYGELAERHRLEVKALKEAIKLMKLENYRHGLIIHNEAAGTPTKTIEPGFTKIPKIKFTSDKDVLTIAMRFSLDFFMTCAESGELQYIADSIMKELQSILDHSEKYLARSERNKEAREKKAKLKEVE